MQNRLPQISITNIISTCMKVDRGIVVIADYTLVRFNNKTAAASRHVVRTLLPVSWCSLVRGMQSRRLVGRLPADTVSFEAREGDVHPHADLGEEQVAANA